MPVNAGSLRGTVIFLHIKTGENQRRRKRISGEQEAALEEQDAIPQEERQQRATQISPAYLAEDQDHRHTDKARGKGSGNYLCALLEQHSGGKPAETDEPSGQNGDSYTVNPKKQG